MKRKSKIASTHASKPMKVISSAFLSPDGDDVSAALLVGDIHSGSDTAPMPDPFETMDGKIIKPNPTQRKLNEIWGEVTQEALEKINGRKFALLLLGDYCEGDHHHNKDVISKDENEHRRIALAMLKPLADAAIKSGGSVVTIAGTAVHDKDQASGIGEELGAIKDPNSNRYCFDRVQVAIQSTILDLAHHQPTTSRSYLEAGRMSILMGNLTNNCARDGFRIPQVIVRAHAHCEGLYSNGRQKYLSMPHFQAKTRYGFRVVGESGQRFGVATMLWQKRGKLPWVDIHSRSLETTEMLQF